MERVCETPAEMRVQKEPAGSEAAEEAPGPPTDSEYLEGQRSNCTNRKKTLGKFDFHRVYLKPDAPLKWVFSLI